MKYTDLNRLGGIGANSSLVEIGQFKYLVDAGLHPKEVGNEALPALEFAKDLDFIILTHCHLDHLGSLPIVARRFPGVPIYTSQPNKTLAPRMLRNSVNVMKRQRKELGIAEYPLFTYSDIDRLRNQLRPLRFERPETIHKNGDEIEITLYPSGHVAGAASILVDHADASTFFTGDILFDDLTTLSGASIPNMEVDIVVTETTRGRTDRPASQQRAAEWERLLNSVYKTVENGGTCVLPVFALGRMQELLAVLHKERKQGRLPRVPIFCGGLGMDIVDYFDQISRETGLIRFRKKIIKELNVQPARLPQRPGKDKVAPGIYVLSSGMMVEHTPSYQVAASILGSEKNSIYFLGYCDPDTPGGKLKACEKGDEFLFEPYDYMAEIKAEILSFDLSGHADRDEIVNLVERMNPYHVILTHGDADARTWFTETLAKFESFKIVNPEPQQTFLI